MTLTVSVAKIAENINKISKLTKPLLGFII